MGKLTIRGIDKMQYSEFWTDDTQILDVKEGRETYIITVKLKGILYDVSLSRIHYKKIPHRSSATLYEITLMTFMQGNTFQHKYKASLRRPNNLVNFIEAFLVECGWRSKI